MKGWILLSVSVAAMAALVVLTPEAEASHFRGGTMYGVPTGNGLEISFEGTIAFRRDYFAGPPNVGTVFLSNEIIDTGPPGATVTFNLRAVAVNAAQNWVLGRIEDASGNPGVKYTYPTATNPTTSGPWQAMWDGSARLSNGAPDRHVNNPDAGWKLETQVNLGMPLNQPPQGLIPPIVFCQVSSLCYVDILNSDADATDFTTIRFATGAEATGGGFNHAGAVYGGGAGACPMPVSLATLPNNQVCLVNVGTGGGVPKLVWNTNGATYYPEPAQRTWYSEQLMLEDHPITNPAIIRDKVPLDFLIRLTNIPPPRWIDPSPCDANPAFLGHGNLKVFKGTTLSFQIRAQGDQPGTLNADPSRAPLTFNTFGAVPAGLVLGAGSGGNPASATVTYTPPAALAAGSTISVYFYVQDAQGIGGTLCQVFVDIVGPPSADFTTTYTDSPVGLACGESHSDTSGFTQDGVAFNSQVTPIPSGPLVRQHTWSYGDGSPSTTGNSGGRIYSEDGGYLVSLQTQLKFQDAYQDTTWLQVPNAGGVSHPVTIKNRCPTAAPSGSVSGALVQVADAGGDVDGTIVQRLWDFGDGTPTVDALAPQHRYATSGDYRICVRAFDNDGAEANACTMVHVTIHFDAQNDADRDGIGDLQDNCPYVANASQADADGDGIGDLCDESPQGPGSSPGSTSESSTRGKDDQARDASGQARTYTPGVDTDRDGIEDVADNCPEHANPSQADLDQDGQGDACDWDLDGDGVAERAPVGMPDNCPLVANPAQEDRDSNGIGDACDPNLAALHTDAQYLAGSGSGCMDCRDVQTAVTADPAPTTDVARAAGLVGILVIAAGAAAGLVALAIRRWKA